MNIVLGNTLNTIGTIWLSADLQHWTKICKKGRTSWYDSATSNNKYPKSNPGFVSDPFMNFEGPRKKSGTLSYIRHRNGILYHHEFYPRKYTTSISHQNIPWKKNHGGSYDLHSWCPSGQPHGLMVGIPINPWQVLGDCGSDCVTNTIR